MESDYYERGIAALNKIEYQKAAHFFEAGVARGDINCTYMLALLYDHGNGVEQNLKKARALYQTVKNKMIEDETDAEEIFDINSRISSCEQRIHAEEFSEGVAKEKSVNDGTKKGTSTEAKGNTKEVREKKQRKWSHRGMAIYIAVMITCVVYVSCFEDNLHEKDANQTVETEASNYSNEPIVLETSYSLDEATNSALNYFRRFQNPHHVTCKFYAKRLGGTMCQITGYSSSSDIVAQYTIDLDNLIGTDDINDEPIDLKDYIIEQKRTLESRSGPSSTNDEMIPNPEGYTYIINKGTKKIHKFSCGTAVNAYENNPDHFKGTYDSLDELINEGYSPCGNCLK